MSGLKLYPHVNDLGLPWLGHVPERWKVDKLRHLLRQHTERNRPDLPLLSVVRERGIVVRDLKNSDDNHNFVPDDLSNYKVVKRGQFAMNKMKAWQGSFGVSAYDGIVSPAYFVFDLAGVEPNFFHWAIRSRTYVPEFARASDGVRIGQWDLAEQRMRDIAFALPPPGEQAAIVRFLDHATTRIGKAIRAKQSLVKLLEEEKQAIIHRAVTRGLDPNAPLKPSGVEWLGDMPEHWHPVRLGRFVELTTGFPFRSDGFTQNVDDVRLLRGINIAPGKVRWQDTVRWPQHECDQYSEFELRIGDTVLGMDRPIIRDGIRVAIVGEADVPALLLQRVARIRPANGLNAAFLGLLLAGKSFADYLTPIFTGISVPHLSPEQIKSFQFALPPNREQQEIVHWLNERTIKLQTACVIAENEISLIREYRTRLIADVVTGKLDVREAAAQLPEESPNPEAAVGAEAWADEESAESEEMDSAASEEAEA